MSREITYYEKDGKTYWSCGCVSFPKMVKGKQIFVHQACNDKNCPVVNEVHSASAKRRIPVQHHRAEDIKWS